jgi:hypothetical protein
MPARISELCCRFCPKYEQEGQLLGQWCATKAHRRSNSFVQLCCIRDEGRPLEVWLQDSASNHHELLWPKALVVSVVGKGIEKVSGAEQEDERK